VILDAGAVIAGSRGDQRVRRLIHEAVAAKARLSVPSVVVAETVRGHGARDAAVNRLIAEIEVVTELDEATAREAGRLLGVTGSAATIDAIVVASAARGRGGRIVSGDPGDLVPLARATANVTVHAI